MGKKIYLWVSIGILFFIMSVVLLKYDVDRAEAQTMCIPNEPKIACDWDGWFLMKGDSSSNWREARFCCKDNELRAIDNLYRDNPGKLLDSNLPPSPCDP